MEKVRTMKSPALGEDRRRGKAPEILAPAGSMEGMRAAIAAGCDAVYMGGNRFGARAYAENPDRDEMKEAIRYCHRYGVKLYMTVNTLLKQKEMDQLYDFMKPFYEEGVDAAIVQDTGVLAALHRYFPDLPLHASTQMSLVMGTSSRYLEKYGVTRLVPARELTLEELCQMRRDTSLELEVFVHGAFCYSYSGMCLFSSMLGGRSGNRGRCAQPCRKQYRLEYMADGGQADDPDAHWLSPKEHCALPHIGELIAAGVDSLKIEGRMKRPEYVALVTSIYRKHVDRHVALGEEEAEIYEREHADEWKEDFQKLLELYNREGFSDGYLEGTSGVPCRDLKGRGDMLAKNRPNHGGVRVGRVIRAGERAVTYHLDEELFSQDVVEFRNARQQALYEYTIGKLEKSGTDVTAKLQKGSRVRKNDEAFRTRNARLLDEIRERYIRKEAKLPVSMVCQAKAGEPLYLKASVLRKDGSIREVACEGEVCELARNRAVTEEEVRQLLCQTGDTAFEAVSCEVCLEGSVFLPVGRVKQLRRIVLQRLQEQMEDRGKRELKTGSSYTGTDICEGRQTADVVRTVAVLYRWQAQLAFECSRVDEVYLRMDQMEDKELLQCIYEGHEKGKRVRLMLPAVFRAPACRREKEKLSDPDSIWHRKELGGAVIRNLESYYFLTEEAGMEPENIITDACLYTMNREAAAFWRAMGMKEQTLPYELTGKELSVFSGMSGLEAVVYGYVPLMVSAQCLHHNQSGCAKRREDHGGLLWLMDEKKRKFPVFNACKYCYNIIYHGIPLSLKEEEAVLYGYGIRRFRTDLTLEDAGQAERILRGELPEGQKGHFYKDVL